ncbi:MAG TPA: beta-ketoacyl synthase N-terminal-like domain-containing protein [Polyangiaceae bacterium]|nr:beta-ketoacyl synthase N-terminal-like domain-containing protein [Polyangiaceae bacterium]
MRTARRTAVLHDVVITGIGVILPNCDEASVFWQQVKSGQSQLRIEPDPGDAIQCAIGRVRDFSGKKYLSQIPEKLWARCSKEQLFYLSSVVRACQDAGLTLGELASEHVGLFDGTSRGSLELLCELVKSDGKRPSLRDFNLGALPGQSVGIAASIFGVRGPTYTYNGSCASGAIAIGNAFREIQSGRISVACGTGHDAALVAPLFQVYRDAGLMSAEAVDPSRAIRPYSGSFANAFGEGAVTVVLESREHAETRGARVLADLIGYRYGNGGQHPTDVDFTGERPARLILESLTEADVTPDDVDFVIGHGNGVLASDISELNYMKRVFGDRTREIPLISTKPVYGHTLGAASAINVAVGALMLHHAFVAPTIGVDRQRVVSGFNHQANEGSSRLLRSGVVVSYGAGGQNAAIIMQRAKR